MGEAEGAGEFGGDSGVADEEIMAEVEEQVGVAFGDSPGADTFEAVNFVEKFVMPPAPADYVNHPPREFKRWTVFGAAGYLYQGEWDPAGNADGRGVAIC